MEVKIEPCHHERPAAAFLSGSISACVENGFVRNAMHPVVQRSLSNGRVLIAGHVDDWDGKPCSLEVMPQLDAGPVV